MEKKMTKKEIRKKRDSEHWKFWLPDPLFDWEGKKTTDYDADKWIPAFLVFQSHGRGPLSEDEWNGIQPLISGQRNKEITISSIIEESMEFWANGWGCLVPLRHTFDTNKTDARKLDRKTLAAMIKIFRQIREDSVGFFKRTSAISEDKKTRYINHKYGI